MAETLTIRTASSTEVVKIAVQGPQGPKGDKGDPGDVAGLPLSTLGDTLYRGASENQRLPIGTTGQVLKVSAQGLPAWANESGAVTSVNGQTGAVTLTPADIDAAEANHSHNSADVLFQGLEILGAGNANTNGVYVYGGDLNGKGVYYKDKDTFVYWDGAAWMISHNADDIYSSAQNTTTPWQVTSWSVEAGQTSPAPSSWDRVTGDQWEAVVGQRTNPTLRGDAAGKNVGTGANDVAAGNHTHSSATTMAAGFLSASDKTKLDGIAAGAEVNVNADWNASSGDAQILNKPTIPSASSATPQALGVAAAGSSNDFARADHVHAMPSASDVGAADINHAHNVFADISAALSQDPDAARSELNLGTAATSDSTDFAAASHTHAASDITSGSFGNISHDGKLGSTAGLPVVTTTAGAVTTLALGTAGQVLTVNSGATGVEFAAPSGGGFGEVRFDTSGNYTYTGQAAEGSSESSAVWFIRRSEFSSAGAYVSTTTANNVEWDDRLTASYS